MSTFYSDFGDMLPHQVLVSVKIGTDSYNAPTYAAPQTFQARVVYGFKLVRNRTGEMVPASGTVWMHSRFRLKEEDKYEFLSDEENSPMTYTKLNPMRVDCFPDENGFYYSKVYFS